MSKTKEQYTLQIAQKVREWIAATTGRYLTGDKPKGSRICRRDGDDEKLPGRREANKP